MPLCFTLLIALFTYKKHVQLKSIFHVHLISELVISGFQNLHVRVYFAIMILDYALPSLLKVIFHVHLIYSLSSNVAASRWVPDYPIYLKAKVT